MNSQIIYEGGYRDFFFFFASVTQLSDFIANKYEGVFNINDTMTLFQSPISLVCNLPKWFG